MISKLFFCGSCLSATYDHSYKACPYGHWVPAGLHWIFFKVDLGTSCVSQLLPHHVRGRRAFEVVPPGGLAPFSSRRQNSQTKIVSTSVRAIDRAAINMSDTFVGAHLKAGEGAGSIYRPSTNSGLTTWNQLSSRIAVANIITDIIRRVYSYDCGWHRL